MKINMVACVNKDWELFLSVTEVCVKISRYVCEFVDTSLSYVGSCVTYFEVLILSRCSASDVLNFFLSSERVCLCLW